MKSLRWLLPLVSLLLVAALTWWDLSRSQAGPGPLHPAHFALAEMQQGGNCAACHRDGAVAASACLACHEAIRAQAYSGTGLHGSLVAWNQTEEAAKANSGVGANPTGAGPTDPGPAAKPEPRGTLMQCAQCHPEHHGDAISLVPDYAFQRIGIDLEHYDHRHVDFTLTGAHQQQTCVSCHKHAEATTPPAGGRYLGLSQQCTSCHDDVHEGAFGSECAECHGQEHAWPAVPGFSHTNFPLVDAHATVTCAQCHAEGSDRNIEAEKSQSLSTRNCNACHQDPHTAHSPPPKSLHFAAAQDCSRCHVATTWESARPSNDEHALLGFALRGAHAQMQCGECHGDDSHEPLWSGQPPAATACTKCHSHPHLAQLIPSALASTRDSVKQGAANQETNDCADCHRDEDPDFAAGRISAQHHLATGFALATPHNNLACTVCHLGAEWHDRFPGRTATDCRTCHDDAHGGQFLHEGRVQQCTECHHQQHFLPHQFGSLQHADSFPLTGSHDAVACSNCHDQIVDGVRQFRNTPDTCRGCHDDAHAGRFDRAGQAKHIDQREGCARCHDTTTFTHVVTEFDHALWTGYALIDAHTQVACDDCHTGASNHRLGKAPGKTCANCHQDPHVGQFAQQGQTDCRRCHEPSKWQNIQFDHQQHSRFALDSVHAALDCASCHPSYPLNGRQVVRYKPLGTKCGDCHQLGEGHRRR